MNVAARSDELQPERVAELRYHLNRLCGSSSPEPERGLRSRLWRRIKKASYFSVRKDFTLFDNVELSIEKVMRSEGDLFYVRRVTMKSPSSSLPYVVRIFELWPNDEVTVSQHHCACHPWYDRSSAKAAFEIQYQDEPASNANIKVLIDQLESLI